ncbi:MAG TPA: extracellular solute-binding protein, partial [Anaerolineae bacterium]|nr:extracellular solute-binding protein [Anaerolineae bacterium]
MKSLPLAPAYRKKAAESVGPTPDDYMPIMVTEPVTISIWHSWHGEYYNNIEKIFRQYEQINSNVKIKLVNVPELNDKVGTAVSAGKGPDIVAWVHDTIGRNAEIGIIAPLNDYLPVNYLEDNYVLSAVEAVTYRGQFWALPESLEVITFIYNKDLISEDELPRTIDDSAAR